MDVSYCAVIQDGDEESCQVKERASTKAEMVDEEEESCQTKDNDQLSGKLVDGVREGKREECEGEDGPVFFSVGDVRKRLSQHHTAPKKTFERDPEDPSGRCIKAFKSCCDCRRGLHL